MARLSKNILFWFRMSLNLSSHSDISPSYFFFLSVRVEIMLSLICGAQVEEEQEWTCRRALLCLPHPKSRRVADAARQVVLSLSETTVYVLQAGLVALLSNNHQYQRRLIPTCGVL